MGFTIDFSVLNQKGTPALYTDTFANRPAFGYAGRLFIANDTAAIYEDTGTAWVLIANVSSGAGTLQQVTTNGNTSNVGISVTAGGVSTNSATITSLTQGSVPFVGAAGLITQDNTNLFFDDTNNRLGINTNTPTNNLDVHGSGTIPIIAINNTAGNQSLIGFAKNSTAKWRIGNSSTDTFDVLNVGLTTNAISINSASNCVSFLANLLLKQGTGLQSIATFNGIACDAGGFFFNLGTSTFTAYFNLIGLTAARTYTYPDATGTLALTSDLTSYVPYTGATAPLDLGANGLTVGNGTADNRIICNPNNAFALGIRNTNTSNVYYLGVTNSAATADFQIYNSFVAAKIFSMNYQGISYFTNNVIINSVVDDTVNKLQVTGTSKFNNNIEVVMDGTVNNAGISITAVNSGGAGSQPSLLFKDNLGVRKYNFMYDVNSDIFYLNDSALNPIISSNQAGSIRIYTLQGTGSRAVLADANGALTAPVSDETVKENIQTLQYGLNTIMQLNPISFEYINEYKNYGEGLQIGNIAQDVAKVIPEAVFTTPSTGLMGINYNQFDGIYIKAIQELNNKIDTLLQRIELLENK